MESINSVLNNLKLDATCINEYSTSSSIFYDLKLGYNCSVKKLSNHLKEIEFRLGASSPLFLKIIPEESCIRIQNLKNIQSNILFEKTYSSKSGILPIVLGSDYEDNILFSDFANHPHTLIAGTTGSGKSMALHNIICNALLNKNIKIYLSDSKGVEFSCYKSCKNVKSICSSYSENIDMISHIENEMNFRFHTMNYHNENDFTKLYGLDPLIVIIDELADLILQDSNNKFKKMLLSVAQKSRAAGIFLIAATQRPSVDVLSGVIKANFPARISLKTASVTDSKVILDQPGSEKLNGKGDAIIKNEKFNYVRFKFPFIDPKNILKKNNL